MKAHVQRNFFNEPINQNHLCERTLVSSDSLPSSLWRWALGLFTLVRKSQSSRPSVHAGKDQAAGQRAPLLQILVARVTRRVLVSLWMMGVVAPLSACVYMLCDRMEIVQGWYHVNYFHLLLLLGPSLFLLSCLIGMWFMFPYRSARAYGLVVPAGFTIGKIMWLIQCTSNEDFYSIVPVSFILIGALISVFVFLASDWLTHSVFHREHAFDRREGTLYNGADLIDGEQFKGLFKKYVEEKKAFQKQF